MIRPRVLAAALLISLALYWASHRNTAKPPAPAAPEEKKQENVPTPPKPPTPVPAPDPAAREFEERTQAALKRLPKTEDLRKLPTSQLHHTPPAIVEAASRIGAIAGQIEANPALAPQGLRFYLNCALRSDVSLTLRSLCYTKLRVLERRLGQGPTPGSEAIPTEVVRAAEQGLER